MKKILLSFMAMALLATSANAQVFNKEVKESAKVELNNKFTAAKVKVGPKRLKDNQQLLGYPGSTGANGLGSIGFKSWDHATLVLSAFINSEVATTYKGYKVVGLNFAVSGSLGANNVYASAVFYNGPTDKEGTEVNTALTKYDISERSSDNKIDVKWNEVMFDESYTLTGNEDQIMYGFVFDSSAADDAPILVGAEEKNANTKYGFIVYGRELATEKDALRILSFKDGFYVPCFQLIVESPNGETGILGVDGTLQPVPSKYYTLDGKQLSAPQKGLNLVKMSDGTTRKVVK